MITLDNPKTVITFVVPMQTDQALLANIKAEIAATGGVARMGYVITNHEARDWFGQDTKKYFRERNRWNETRAAKQGKKLRKDIWLPADIKFMLANFGMVKTALIGDLIGRTAVAIRLKFAEIATREQKIEASKRANKSRRSTNYTCRFE